MIEFHEFHDVPTARAFEWVITKGQKNAVPPTVEGKEDFLFFF